GRRAPLHHPQPGPLRLPHPLAGHRTRPGDRRPRGVLAPHPRPEHGGGSGGRARTGARGGPRDGPDAPPDAPQGRASPGPPLDHGPHTPGHGQRGGHRHHRHAHRRRRPRLPDLQRGAEPGLPHAGGRGRGVRDRPRHRPGRPAPPGRARPGALGPGAGAAVMSLLGDTWTYYQDNQAMVDAAIRTHVRISAISIALAAGIGLSLGIVCAKVGRLTSFLIVTIGNLGRTVPTFAVIALVAILYTFGPNPAA